MRRFSVSIAILLLAWCPIGCQSNSEGTDSSDVSRATGSDTDVGPGKSCQYQLDCPETTYCHNRECREAPECRAPAEWETCVSELASVDIDLAPRAVCREGHCQVACVHDTHCPDEYLCTDYGRCRKFDGPEVRFERDSFENRPSNLRAGVGEAPLDFPIGVPLAGFPSRAAENPGRYGEALAPSRGQMHRLDARAIALENETDRVLLVRLPIVFATMDLHEAVARRLDEVADRKWRDELVVAATHTHAGPARFFRIPDETVTSFARFGVGGYSQRIFDWLVASATEAGRRALRDLRPAKLGTRTVEGFDTGNAIASDRRGENPPFDDNRLLLVRIDEAGGGPMAAAISMGVHGTVHSGPYATGDVPGALERGLEREIAATFDTRAPVLFFNQNGGSMSPRGGQRSHSGPQRMEKLGTDFADRAIAAFDEIETDRAIRLDSTTYRFPISYDRLGYGEGEFGDSELSTIDDQFQYGALRCHGEPTDKLFETHIAENALNCLGLHRITDNRPPTPFLRSQISFLRIANQHLVTLPGEPSMSFGWQAIRRIHESTGVSAEVVWPVGYAQDHLFYLLATNLRGDKPPFEGLRRERAPKLYPDRAFSFLQGGYETSRSPWGWRLGDYLADRAATAASILLEPDSHQRSLPETWPLSYRDGESSDVSLAPSPDERVGEVVEQVPERVERFRPIEFGWIGGDPAAEMPQAPRVSLQRRRDGSFETVQTDSRRPYDNRSAVMLTRTRRTDTGWAWVIYWEELEAFPTGTYRFRVEGHHGEERRSYTVDSRTFEVVPSDDVEVTVRREADRIVGRLAYPAGGALEYDGDEDDPAAVDGNFRLRHPEVPLGTPFPPEVERDVYAGNLQAKIVEGGEKVETVSGLRGTLEQRTETVGGYDDVPRTHFSLPLPDLDPGEYTVDLSLVDAHGNRGSGSVDVEIQ